MSCASAASYLHAAIAPTTRATYDTAVRSFRSWRVAHRLLPEEPITAQHTLRWLAYLADGGTVSAATISVYKAGLRNASIEELHPDGDGVTPVDHPLVKRLLTGIANVKADIARAPTAHAAPLTFPLVQRLRASYGDELSDVMRYAALALSVAATLRPSELLGSKAAGLTDRALRRGQITFHADMVPLPSAVAIVPRLGEGVRAPRSCSLSLKQTKTKRAGETKAIATADAVAALWRWMCLSSGVPAAPDDLLFSLKGKPLSTCALTRDVTRRLKAIGIVGLDISGKSMRRGGASTLAAQGVPAEQIAAQGWAPGSHMWSLYANDPEVQRMRRYFINAQMQGPAVAAGAGAAADLVRAL